jgi:hypothetical protein
VGEVGGRLGGAIWAAFAIAIALAFFTAAAYAELVTKYPQAAGAALYVNKAFGVSFATFMVAFAVMASGLTSASTLARAFGGDYLGEFVSVPTVAVAINARGIGESVKLNVGFTLVELGGLLLVVVIGAAALLDGLGDPGRALEIKEGEALLPAVMAGAGLAFYALIGFEDSVNVAEEARDPQRTYPRALFGGLLIAGAVYLAVSAIASMAVPTDTLAGSSGPLLEVRGLRALRPGLAAPSPSRKPSRQLGQRGCQPSSRRARAFEAPRICVKSETPAAPAASRPTQRGTRRGGGAPRMRASWGSQTVTGAGSSSATLRIPGGALSRASTVAVAASSRWTNDQTPAPSPTTGSRCRRTCSIIAPPSPMSAPGP